MDGYGFGGEFLVNGERIYAETDRAAKPYFDNDKAGTILLGYYDELKGTFADDPDVVRLAHELIHAAGFSHGEIKYKGRVFQFTTDYWQQISGKEPLVRKVIEDAGINPDLYLGVAKQMRKFKQIILE